MSEPRPTQAPVASGWSPERIADVGRGVEICCQTLGDPSDPPLLLIMGVGSQMIAWPDGFCEALAERGYHVIRFDNRDCGRSTWLSQLGVPSLTKAWEKQLDDPPYLLSDLADDCAGVVDALELDAAHVVGASLGGFGGCATAEAIPGAELVVIDGWGHDLPPGVWEQLAEAIGKTQTTPDDESVGFMESAVDALGQWDSSPRESFGSVASGIYSGTAMLNRPTRRSTRARRARLSSAT